MAQDNTLGAPTEGLGQTVTFGLGGSGGVPQAQADQRNMLRNTAQGQATMTSQALQIPETKQNATFETLARLGGEILKPQMEQARSEAFVRGWRQAQSGEAVKEIVDEQPWYAKLLGDMPVADGARAYTSSAKAANVAAQLEEDMPNLRKLEGREFDKHVAGILDKQATGDAVTDMMFQKHVMQTLPSVGKTWAKASIRYKQELAENAYTANLQGNLQRLHSADANARMPGSTSEAADTIEVAIPLLEAMDNPGMDKAHHDKLVTSAVVGAISAGNLAAYNMLTKADRLTAMSPEAQFQIQRAYRQASSDAKVKLPLEFAQQLAEFRTMQRTATDEASIVAAAQKLNKEYTRVTGDPGMLMGAATTAQEIAQFQDAEARREDAARREIGKANSAAEKKRLEEEQLSSDAARVTNPAIPFSMAGFKDAEAQAVFDRVRTSSPEKALLAAALQWEHKVYDKALQDRIQSGALHAMRLSDPTMFYEVYKTAYVPLVKAGGDNGAAIASTYAGRAEDTLSRYHELVAGRDLSPLDQQAYYVEAANPPPKVADPKLTEKVAAELRSNTLMGLVKATGATDNLEIIDPDGLSKWLTPRINKSLPLDQAVEKAKHAAENLTVLGGHYWTRSAGSTDVKQWVDKNRGVGWAAPDTQGRAMRHAIDAYASQVNIEGTPQVIQVQDAPGGIPQFIVRGETPGGTRSNVFTAKDMNDKWVERNKAAPWVFGPAITYVPAEGAPSIYAGEAEWKAYRERQANK